MAHHLLQTPLQQKTSMQSPGGNLQSHNWTPSMVSSLVWRIDTWDAKTFCLGKGLVQGKPMHGYTKQLIHCLESFNVTSRYPVCPICLIHCLESFNVTSRCPVCPICLIHCLESFNVTSRYPVCPICLIHCLESFNVTSRYPVCPICLIHCLESFNVTSRCPLCPICLIHCLESFNVTSRYPVCPICAQRVWRSFSRDFSNRKNSLSCHAVVFLNFSARIVVRFNERRSAWTCQGSGAKFGHIMTSLAWSIIIEVTETPGQPR